MQMPDFQWLKSRKYFKNEFFLLNFRFIIPLVEDGLNDKHVFDAKSEGRYPQILGSVVGILPTMKADPVLQPKMPVSAPLV